MLPTCTKRWYRLDGRLDWSYPSSPTAWSRKYLPDDSSKSSISAGLDKPDDELGTRTDGQPLRGPHPHSRVSGEAVGAKCGPARRFPRAEAGGHRGQCRCPRHRFAYVLRRSWLGWSFTPMSRGVRIASMCWSTGHWSGLSGMVCRLNSSAAGPGPDAATAMQHSTAEAPASSVAITPSIASLSRSARPRGSESSSCAASPEYPSHPNCWYSPVGWVYSPHSNVI